MVNWLVLLLVAALALGMLLRCGIEWGMPLKQTFAEEIQGQSGAAKKPPNEKKVFAAALLFRVLMLLVSVVIVMLSQKEIQSVQQCMERINLWDARHYTNLIEQGYAGYVENGQHLFLVFFPAYVWLVRAVRLLIPNTLLAGMLTSFVCYAWGCCWVHKLAYEQYDEETANYAVLFLSLFPFSFFFGTVMTEGLFLLTTAAAIYYAMNRKWVPYMIWGMLAAMTRMTGVLVVIPAFVELLKSVHPLRSVSDFKKAVPKVLKKILLIAVPCLGTLMYLLLNYHVDADPFAFTIHQKHWHQGPMLISNVVQYIADYLWNNFKTSSGWAIWVPELVLFVLTFLILAAAVRRAENPASLIAYGFVYFVMNYSLSWLLSAGRYLSCGFVLFIFLASRTKGKKELQISIIVTEALFLIVYLYAYLSGAQVM